MKLASASDRRGSCGRGRLGGGLCDGRLAGHTWLALLGDARQKLLDLGDGTSGVEALGTGLRAVHDGVTSRFIRMLE